MAGNTPFKRYKGHTYGGGVRAPLLIRWPDGIRAKGETRRQFYHVVDIAPTLVDLLGVPLPAQVNGVEQVPLHGVSMARTFNDNDADTRKSVQYFEMVGHRGIWHEGWKAVTFHQPGNGFRLGRLGALSPGRRPGGNRRPGRPVSRKAGGAQGPLVAGGRTLWRASAGRCEPTVKRRLVAGAQGPLGSVPGRRAAAPLQGRAPGAGRVPPDHRPGRTPNPPTRTAPSSPMAADSAAGAFSSAAIVFTTPPTTSGSGAANPPPPPSHQAP